MLWSPWYEKHSFVYPVDLTCTHHYSPNQSKSRHRISMMWLERCYAIGPLRIRCSRDMELSSDWPLGIGQAWVLRMFMSFLFAEAHALSLYSFYCAVQSIQPGTFQYKLRRLPAIWTRCFGICLIGCDSNYKSKAQRPHKIWRLFLLLCPIDAVGKALFLADFVHIFPVSRLSSNAPHVIGAAVFLPYFFVSSGYLTWHLAFWPYLLFCLIQVYDLFSSLHPYVKITSFVLEVDAGLAMLANHYVIWCARWGGVVFANSSAASSGLTGYHSWECSYTFGLDIYII